MNILNNLRLLKNRKHIKSKGKEQSNKTFELVGPFDQGCYVCPECGYGNYTYGFRGTCEKCKFTAADLRPFR